ncbi:protein of unknown function [Candidatus Nitrotoga arctica]|uniref:Uncharacterized protein n=1 Tax=Candidatus Nitrotoga arctica TaxID=453162 RepID=A0ABM8YZ78_9PROT|nr:protein of unknown function [Candidatus Nitrotoga arctica]
MLKSWEYKPEIHKSIKINLNLIEIVKWYNHALLNNKFNIIPRVASSPSNMT